MGCGLALRQPRSVLTDVSEKRPYHRSAAPPDNTLARIGHSVTLLGREPRRLQRFLRTDQDVGELVFGREEFRWKTHPAGSSPTSLNPQTQHRVLVKPTVHQKK